MINDREDWTEMEHEKADIKKRMQYILNMRPVFNKEIGRASCRERV